MTQFVTLLCENTEISNEDFKIRLNEIYLGLPQNVGDGFFKWWCESIHKKAAKFKVVTPEALECWLGGKYAPPPEIREEFLNVARDVVKADVMSEAEFFYHVRYCKEHLDMHFEKKDIAVIAWAEDFFFHRLTLLTPANLEAAMGWFGDRNVWMHVPRISLRMITIRVAAEAVAEAIARDEYSDYQNYIGRDHHAILRAAYKGVQPDVDEAA